MYHKYLSILVSAVLFTAAKLWNQLVSRNRGMDKESVVCNHSSGSGGLMNSSDLCGHQAGMGCPYIHSGRLSYTQKQNYILFKENVVCVHSGVFSAIKKNEIMFFEKKWYKPLSER